MRRGFTLLETLLVIGAVTALLAMLTTGLRTLSSMSRATSCRTNLRQLHLATESYRGLESAYPAAVLYFVDSGALRTTAWDFDHRGDGTIEPGPVLTYLDDDADVFQCPDYRGESTFSNDPATGYNYNTSFIGTEGSLPYLDPSGTLVEGWEACRRGLAVGAVRRTASVALFGDGGWSGGANKFMRAPGNTIEFSLNTVYAGTQAFRHALCTNVVFLDGHVACLDQACKGDHATDELLGSITGFPANGFLSDDDSAYDPR